MAKKKTIVFLIPSIDEVGGAQMVVKRLALLMADRYDVHLCSFSDVGAAVREETSGEITLHSLFNNTAQRSRLDYLRNIMRFRKLTKSIGADVIISNIWAADLVTALAGGRGKRITIIHGSIRNNPQNRLLMRLLPFASYCYRRFHKVVAVSRLLEVEMSELFSLRKSQSAYIYNSIEPHGNFESPNATGNEGKVFRLITVGRLNRTKNVIFIIHILAVLKRKPGIRYRLCIAGDGPEMVPLQQLAASLGLSIAKEESDEADVHFSGFVKSPAALLSKSDLYLSASMAEGLPLSLVEAMDAGLPLLAADCETGPFEIMEGAGEYNPSRNQPEETKYGYLLPVPALVPDERLVQMWAGLVEELRSNAPARAKYAAAGRQRARDFYPEATVMRWFELIESL